jgi:hypothetical protein
MLSPSVKTNSSRGIENIGSPRCSPHANVWPNTCSTAATVAKIRKTSHKPKEYQTFRLKIRQRSSPACWTNAISFKPITGKTQGMIFRIKPPRKLTSKAIATASAVST